MHLIKGEHPNNPHAKGTSTKATSTASTTGANPYPGRSARGPSGKKPMPFGKASALSHALAEKTSNFGKKIGSAIRTGHSNYKNRTDDTNKHKSILYWKDNKN